MKSIAVIIPALNESQSIGYVIDAIPKLVSQILVVDNGSTDLTPEIVKKKGAVLLNECKKGYGFACLKGINYLKTNPPDIVVFLVAHNEFKNVKISGDKIKIDFVGLDQK